MGYTCGRKHTEESLREIAKQYNTRAEFQKKDSSAYSRARKISICFLNSICEHMINGAYSTPQLICKKIMEELLGVKCEYNTKRIITPYELDIYFPEFKLAIEYNGKGWHNSIDSKRRDNNKQNLCNERKITLIHIVENNRDYETDVKNQLISNLKLINKITKNNFSDLDIIKIKCNGVYDDILKTKNIDEIKNKISNCSSIKEFKSKHISEYNFLYKNKKIELLEHLKTRNYYSEDELLSMCKNISDYSEFLKNHHKLYEHCHRKGILEKATAHMHKNRRPYRNHKNEELLELANKFKMKSYIKRQNTSLFLELIKRDILKLVTYEPNFIYKPSLTILKEEKIKKCYKDAEKYDNYSDFKKDTNLYDLCKKYKIINHIVEKFPKEDIKETILEESKKYKNFEDFSKSIWYLKSKRHKGLAKEIKIQNNWDFFKKEKMNYIEKFPNIVELINNDLNLDTIVEIAKVKKTTIWRIKVQMHKAGILKVGYNLRKKDK
jgi:hypothetical protein